MINLIAPALSQAFFSPVQHTASCWGGDCFHFTSIITGILWSMSVYTIILTQWKHHHKRSLVHLLLQFTPVWMRHTRVGHVYVIVYQGLWQLCITYAFDAPTHDRIVFETQLQLLLGSPSCCEGDFHQQEKDLQLQHINSAMHTKPWR